FGYFQINAFNSTRENLKSPEIPWIDDFIPLIPFFSLPYIVCQFLYLLVPLVLDNVRQWKAFLAGFVAMVIPSWIVFLAWPTKMIRPMLDQVEGFTFLIRTIYEGDLPNNILPSSHAYLGLFIWLVIRKQNKELGRFLTIFTISFILSTVFTKQHYFIDVPAGLLLGIVGYLVFLALSDRRAFWRIFRRGLFRIDSQGDPLEHSEREKNITALARECQVNKEAIETYYDEMVNDAVQLIQRNFIFPPGVAQIDIYLFDVSSEFISVVGVTDRLFDEHVQTKISIRQDLAVLERGGHVIEEIPITWDDFTPMLDGGDKKTSFDEYIQEKYQVEIRIQDRVNDLEVGRTFYRSGQRADEYGDSNGMTAFLGVGNEGDTAFGGIDRGEENNSPNVFGYHYHSEADGWLSHGDHLKLAGQFRINQGPSIEIVITDATDLAYSDISHTFRTKHIPLPITLHRLGIKILGHMYVYEEDDHSDEVKYSIVDVLKDSLSQDRKTLRERRKIDWVVKSMMEPMRKPFEGQTQLDFGSRMTHPYDFLYFNESEHGRVPKKIWEQFGLESEFVALFPESDEFWNSELSFYEIYHRLKSRQTWNRRLSNARWILWRVIILSVLALVIVCVIGLILYLLRYLPVELANYNELGNINSSFAMSQFMGGDEGDRNQKGKKDLSGNDREIIRILRSSAMRDTVDLERFVSSLILPEKESFGLGDPAGKVELLNYSIETLRSLWNLDSSVSSRRIINQKFEEIDQLIQAVAKQSYEGEDVKKHLENLGREITSEEKEAMDRLVQVARQETNPEGPLRLLDVGTGPGRHLVYLNQQDDVIADGVEIAAPFIEILKTLKEANQINDIFPVSMSNMEGIPDSQYDVVRAQASLLHSLDGAVGIGAARVIREVHRVLRPGGVLFVLVKEGEGLSTDKAGKRIFQLYTKESLERLLQQNGFQVIESKIKTDNRKGRASGWVSALAQKLVVESAASNEKGDPVIRGMERIRRGLVEAGVDEISDRQMREAIAGFFGVEETDDQARHQLADVILTHLFLEVPSNEREIILEELVDFIPQASWLNTGVHRYMPLASSVANIYSARRILSRENLSDLIGDVDSRYDYLSTNYLQFGNPFDVEERWRPRYYAGQLIPPPSRLSGPVRWLDVGAAPKGNGSETLKLLKKTFAKLVPEREFQFVGTDTFLPPYVFQNGQILRSPFHWDNRTNENSVSLDEIEYADATHHKNNVVDARFEMGTFDFVSMGMTLHHLTAEGELPHPQSISADFKWVDQFNNPLNPIYALTNTQQQSLERLLRSLNEAGGLFFLHLKEGVVREGIMHAGDKRNDGQYLIIRREGEKRFKLYSQTVPFRPEPDPYRSSEFMLEARENPPLYKNPGLISLLPPGAVMTPDDLETWLDRADLLVFRHQSRDQSVWGQLQKAVEAINNGAGIAEVFSVYISNVPEYEPLKRKLIKGIEKNLEIKSIEEAENQASVSVPLVAQIRAKAPIYRVALNHDGSSLLIGTQGSAGGIDPIKNSANVDIANLGDRSVMTFLAEGLNSVSSLGFSSSEDKVVVGQDSGKIEVREIDDASIAYQYVYQPDSSITTDGTGMVVARDQTIQLIDPETNQVQSVIPDRAKGGEKFYVSPNKRFLAGTTWGNYLGDEVQGVKIGYTLKIGDFENPGPRTKWTFASETKDDRIISGAFDPSGQMFAFTSIAGTVRILNVETGDLIMEQKGEENVVTSLSYSPDGKLLVTGGSNGLVQIYNAHSGAFISELTTYRENDELIVHPGRSNDFDEANFSEINFVGFSANGKKLAAVRSLSSYVWDITDIYQHLSDKPGPVGENDLPFERKSKLDSLFSRVDSTFKTINDEMANRPYRAPPADRKSSPTDPHPLSATDIVSWPVILILASLYIVWLASDFGFSITYKQILIGFLLTLLFHESGHLLERIARRKGLALEVTAQNSFLGLGRISIKDSPGLVGILTSAGVALFSSVFHFLYPGSDWASFLFIFGVMNAVMATTQVTDWKDTYQQWVDNRNLPEQKIMADEDFDQELREHYTALAAARDRFRLWTAVSHVQAMEQRMVQLGEPREYRAILEHCRYISENWSHEKLAMAEGEEAWENRRYIKIGTQYSLYRPLRDFGNIVYGWQKARDSVPDLVVNESLSPDHIETDPRAHYQKYDQFHERKPIQMQEGLNDFKKFLRDVPKTLDEDALWNLYEGSYLYLVNTNLINDLVIEGNLKTNGNLIVNDTAAVIDRLKALDPSESHIAIGVDNVGFETMVVLWQAYLLRRLGFTVTVIGKTVPSLMVDATDFDLRYILPYFDYILQDHFGHSESLGQDFEDAFFIEGWFDDDLLREEDPPFDVVFLVGEMWYEYVVGLSDLKGEPYNPWERTDIVSLHMHKDARQNLAVETSPGVLVSPSATENLNAPVIQLFPSRFGSSPGSATDVLSWPVILLFSSLYVAWLSTGFGFTVIPELFVMAFLLTLVSHEGGHLFERIIRRGAVSFEATTQNSLLGWGRISIKDSPGLAGILTSAGVALFSSVFHFLYPGSDWASFLFVFGIMNGLMAVTQVTDWKDTFHTIADHGSGSSLSPFKPDFEDMNQQKDLGKIGMLLDEIPVSLGVEKAMVEFVGSDANIESKLRKLRKRRSGEDSLKVLVVKHVKTVRDHQDGNKDILMLVDHVDWMEKFHRKLIEAQVGEVDVLVTPRSVLRLPKSTLLSYLRGFKENRNGLKVRLKMMILNALISIPLNFGERVPSSLFDLKWHRIIGSNA
ncbi:hypothetical protein BVX98_02545, partial [bacterium F11]